MDLCLAPWQAPGNFVEQREPAKQKDTRAGEGWSEVPLLSNDDLFALYLVTNTNKTRFQQCFSLPFFCQAEEEKEIVTKILHFRRDFSQGQRFTAEHAWEGLAGVLGMQQRDESCAIPRKSCGCSPPVCAVDKDHHCGCVTGNRGWKHRQGGWTAGCSPQVFACYLSSSFIFTELLNCLGWKGS